MTVIAVRKFLLRCVRDVAAGREPPHLVRSEKDNDLRHVACIATKIPSTQDPKQYVSEQLRKEASWEVPAEPSR